MKHYGRINLFFRLIVLNVLVLYLELHELVRPVLSYYFVWLLGTNDIQFCVFYVPDSFVDL